MVVVAVSGYVKKVSPKQTRFEQIKSPSSNLKHK